MPANELETPYLDTLDDFFLGIDTDGALELWNSAVVEVTGHTDADLADMSTADLLAEPAAGRLIDTIADLAADEKTTVEADLLTAADEQLPFEFTVQSGPDDRPVAVVVIGRELSTQREAERDRQGILDRMGDAFFTVDADWRVTYTNRQGAELLARAMDHDSRTTTLEGRDLWENIPEAVDTTFYEAFHRAMETGEAVSLEDHYEPLDAWYEVRAFRSETGLSVYVRDVSERYRQQDQLEHREAVLKELHRITADRDRSFTDQVEALLALGRREFDTEYGSLSDIQGEDYLFEVVDTADKSISAGDVVPLEATNCELAASREETIVLGDISRDAPDETDRAEYTDWGISCYVGAPVYDNDGVYGTFCFYDGEPRTEQFSNWEVTLVDLMSRWVTYELQRRQVTDQLQDQNDELERFTGIVSHDLRNPLAALEGWLEMAEETGDPDHFARCYDNIQRMEALIDDLLTLARTGAEIDDVQQVALGTLAEQAWGSAETAAATLSTETGRRIRADESRLQQLLENLFRNAVKHGGDAVTVTVGGIDDGFYIADDGPGIPADERNTVFEAGHTSDPHGTGFGLTIVEEIVEAHGWTVRIVESDTGGARFEITGVESITE